MTRHLMNSVAALILTLGASPGMAASVCIGQIEQYKHGMPESVMVVFEDNPEGPIKIHCWFDASKAAGQAIMRVCGGKTNPARYCRIEGEFRVEGEAREPIKLSNVRLMLERIKSQEHERTCQGVLTINGTGAHDGSRLVRANNINESCLFSKDSDDGRKIMTVCRMGYGCEVRARVNGDASDVDYIIKVLSVKKK